MSRLTQMLDRTYKASGLSTIQIGKKFGWSQQSFYNWMQGSIPRPQMFGPIADFLGISLDMVEELVDEAKASTGNTKIPPLALGKVTDRKDGRFHFGDVPVGRYAFRVDTKIMEPSLIMGGLAWAQWGGWPQPGNEVLVHAGGSAWIGTFVGVDNGVATIDRATGRREIKNVEAVHVVVLSERVVGGGAGGGNT